MCQNDAEMLYRWAVLFLAVRICPEGRQDAPVPVRLVKGLLQKTNLRQALIYIHFHTEDRILPQIVENFSHFGHAYAGSTVLVGPES